jgi:hypothetical protein
MEYLKGQKEKEARQAIARLLRNKRPLNSQLRWHLADLFDPSGWQPRKLKFGNVRGGRTPDRAANVHLFSLVYDEVRGGKGVTQAIQNVAKQFSLSDEIVTRVWSKYSRLYLPDHKRR